MAGDASTSGGQDLRTLEYTPTWVLATVSTVFIVISIAVERFLHFLGNYLREHNRKPLLAALLKMKDELMLMGFISLTITILQDPVSRICVRESVYNKWTPCDISKRPVKAAAPSANEAEAPASRRRLLATESTNTCKAGYEPFISAETIHQLHIFIVVMALVHVVCSCLTLLLALAKVYRWRKWENEAHEAAAQATMPDLIENVTYRRQSTFVRYHTSKPWSRSRFIVWMVCFFQQFYIPRADYLALRLSFIAKHHLKDSYDFHAYVVRTMEDEFETIVGISVWLWASVLAFWFLNVDGSQLYFWMSLLPVIVVFVIGTKLQHVIATLALESGGKRGAAWHAGGGMGVLKPRDQLFWFNRPRLLLFVIHLVLFETAFEFATFIWHVWQFGYNTCLLESNKLFTWARLSSAFAVLLFSSYSTLPLYALVTQMGSSYKKAMVTQNVERVLLRWHKDAKHRLKVEASSVKGGSSKGGSSSDGTPPPSSASMVVHFKSKVTRKLATRASFSGPTAVRNADPDAHSRSLDSSPSTVLPFYMRQLQPGRQIPGSLRASPTTSPETRPAQNSSTNALPSSTTIGAVEYLPPHPAFNHSRPAQLQRQSSAPNFEIHPC